MVTNIIIRCTNGVGHPGNCNDKYVPIHICFGLAVPLTKHDSLAGEPPLGVSYAPCMFKAHHLPLRNRSRRYFVRRTNLPLGYQSSTSAGDAACSKNGIVYGANGPFPVPGGTVSSSSVASASATPSATANVTTASNATGTTAGSGSTPKLTPTPSAYTGDASSVFALGDRSQSLGSAVALLGLAAGMGWLL